MYLVYLEVEGSEMRISDWKKEVVNMEVIGSLLEDLLVTTQGFSWDPW